MTENKGIMLVVSGPAGSGKGTVNALLLSRDDFVYSVSATTRPPRPGEVDGVHYYFITKEKFEAMITLAADNSRMKDFFDVYRILKFHQLDLDMLRQAIEATFANRNTQLEENHLLFRDEFANDDRRNSYWKAFLKRIKWKEELDFKDVWKYITDNLKPYYDNMLPEA